MTAVPPLYTLSLAEARAADLAAIRAASGSQEQVHEVVDVTIEGPATPLPVRIYRPSARAAAGARLLLRRRLDPGQPRHLRRGLSGLGQRDRLSRGRRRLPARAGVRGSPPRCTTASPASCGWAATPRFGGDPARIAVGGDSAGGNLAAAVTLLARDRGSVALAGQLLVYPNTDYRADTRSLRESTDEAMFNRRSVAWYWRHYLCDRPTASTRWPRPCAPDHSGLPPALVITAEYDPLRDEGEHYAERSPTRGSRSNCPATTAWCTASLRWSGRSRPPTEPWQRPRGLCATGSPQPVVDQPGQPAYALVDLGRRQGAAGQPDRVAAAAVRVEEAHRGPQHPVARGPRPPAAPRRPRPARRRTTKKPPLGTFQRHLGRRPDDACRGASSRVRRFGR